MTSYAVALGSNRSHGTYGGPRRVIAAAVKAIADQGLTIERVSSVKATAAMGPAGRSFANAAVLLTGTVTPPELLDRMKQVERAFGRRPGRRWGPRVLDIDILLWSDGCWEGPGLVVPHPELRERGFVLDPLSEIAPGWRDPITGATVRQLRARLRRRVPRRQASPARGD